MVLRSYTLVSERRANSVRLCGHTHRTGGRNKLERDNKKNKPRAPSGVAAIQVAALLAGSGKEDLLAPHPICSEEVPAD